MNTALVSALLASLRTVSLHAGCCSHGRPLAGYSFFPSGDAVRETLATEPRPSYALARVPVILADSELFEFDDSYGFVPCVQCEFEQESSDPEDADHYAEQEESAETSWNDYVEACLANGRFPRLDDGDLDPELAPRCGFPRFIYRPENLAA